MWNENTWSRVNFRLIVFYSFASSCFLYFCKRKIAQENAFTDNCTSRNYSTRCDESINHSSRMNACTNVYVRSAFGWMRTTAHWIFQINENPSIFICIESRHGNISKWVLYFFFHSDFRAVDCLPLAVTQRIKWQRWVRQWQTKWTNSFSPGHTHTTNA